MIIPAVHGQELVQPIRRSIVLLVIRMFIILFVADTLYALLVLIPALGYISVEYQLTYFSLLWFVHTVKNIVLSYMTISLVVNWTSTLYYITSGHLFRQRGVINIHESVFQLTDIESVYMNQSWLGRVFNYGDILINLQISRQKEVLTLYAIENPHIYEELFSRYV